MTIQRTGLFCLLLLVLSLAGCGDDPLPEYYGVYAFDKGTYLKLDKNTPEELRRNFSPEVQILIYDRSINNLNRDALQKIKIRQRIFVRFDIEDVQDENKNIINTLINPSENRTARIGDPLPVQFKPISSNGDMLLIVPEKPLAPALYLVDIPFGDDFNFGIGIGNVAESESPLNGCNDKWMRVGFAWGMPVSQGGYNIMESTYKPCAEWNANGLAATVRSGNVEALDMLLKADFDINEKDPTYGLSPLTYAVEKGDYKIVEFLLARGASTTAQNSDGTTPAVRAKWLNDGTPSRERVLKIVSGPAGTSVDPTGNKEADLQKFSYTAATLQKECSHIQNEDWSNYTDDSFVFSTDSDGTVAFRRATGYDRDIQFVMVAKRGRVESPSIVYTNCQSRRILAPVAISKHGIVVWDSSNDRITTVDSAGRRSNLKSSISGSPKASADGEKLAYVGSFGKTLGLTIIDKAIYVSEQTGEEYPTFAYTTYALPPAEHGDVVAWTPSGNRVLVLLQQTGKCPLVNSHPVPESVVCAHAYEVELVQSGVTRFVGQILTALN